MLTVHGIHKFSVVVIKAFPEVKVDGHWLLNQISISISC